MIGRKQPYTEIGISRVPCIRCGKPSQQQWQVCANDNRYLGVCNSCDYLLNKTVLNFFKLPNRRELLKQYAKNILSRNKSKIS